MCGTERDILASSGHGKLMHGAEGGGKWARLNAEGKEKTGGSRNVLYLDWVMVVSFFFETVCMSCYLGCPELSRTLSLVLGLLAHPPGFIPSIVRSYLG